jgi:hypothetical protein
MSVWCWHTCHDISLSDDITVGYILSWRRKNYEWSQWSMKCWSWWPISVRCWHTSHDASLCQMTWLGHIVSWKKTMNEVNEAWNVGHGDLLFVWGWHKNRPTVPQLILQDVTLRQEASLYIFYFISKQNFMYLFIFMSKQNQLKKNLTHQSVNINNDNMIRCKHKTHVWDKYK